ncbi:MAG: sortase [Patescibacteria group bacterium]|mgnify:CR=1 FL=1
MEDKGISENNKFWRFVKRSIAVFAILLVLLTAIGLSPTPVKEVNNFFFSLFIKDNEEKKANEVLKNEEIFSERTGVYSEPIRIVIRAIEMDNTILSPQGTAVAVLDAALLKGVVHYPGSGDLESKRNMFLLGHSSYLPVVHNQAYKAFNGIQKLKVGDLIELYGKDKKYVYVVEKMEKTTADDGFIDIGNFERKLILATCDSFGKKQDRFIVTAKFVEATNI